MNYLETVLLTIKIANLYLTQVDHPKLKPSIFSHTDFGQLWQTVSPLPVFLH